MNRAGLAVLLALLSWPPAAGEQTATTMFGISLGQPYNYPACDEASLPIPPKGASFCGWKVNNSTRLGSEEFNVVTAEQMPTWASTYPLHLYVRDGQVRAFEIVTSGAESQSFVFAELEAKFGKPSAMHREEKQNALGAKVATIIASWSRQDGVVMFNGVGDKFDKGSITAITTAELKTFEVSHDQEKKF